MIGEERSNMKQRKLEALFYSLLSVCCIVILAAGYLYGISPKYEQFVTGLTTWTAYPKKADMQVVQLFLLGIPACFFIFQAILKKEEAFTKERRSVFLFVKIGYVIFLCTIFAGKDLWKQWGILYLFCIICFLALGKKVRQQEYINTLLVGLFSYLSMTAIVEGSTIFFKAFETRLILQQAAFVLQIASFIIMPGLYIRFIRKWEEEKANKIFGYSKVLLPLGLLGFFTFYYRTAENVVVQLFYSGAWKLVCVFLGILAVVYEGYRLFRKNYGISVITVILVGLLRIFTVPDGILNVDFFHMGEMTLPMQQLVSYGKLPYFDLVPIHGLCDYYYQIWNYLFFDGTYLSFNGAMVVGNLIFVIFYGILFYRTIENKKTAVLFMYAFIPFFVNLAGMRYICVFAFFFLMFSKQVRRNSLSYLWWWVLLSIISISWNASLGGAAAIGFLPSVIYRLVKKMPGELPLFWKERRKKLLISYGVLALIGISFIPLFLQIVFYLRENTATTLYVNGMEMLEDVSSAASYFIPGLLNTQGTFFLKGFCVLGAIGICLYYSAYGECITLLVSMLVFANYAYVRYEEGLRAKILGIFFLTLTLLFIMKEKASKKMVYLLVFGFLAISVNDTLFLTAEQVLPFGEIPASIETEIAGKTEEDPVVYITGEQTVIENLGTGFIRGSTLNSLNNIEFVLNQALDGKRKYLDLTNGIAQTVILDRETGMSYTSGYNISNNLLNENAIKELEENPPEFILIAPYIKLDDVPLSLRAMQLYEYILREGYKPYQYENVIYMIKGENRVEGSSDGKAAFADLMHREYLAKLPAVWANADSVSNLREIQISYSTKETETGMELAMEKQVSGEDISYVMISFPEGALKELKEKEGRLWLEFGEYRFSFDVWENDYLIPVASSPYWKWQESIESLILKGDEKLDTKGVNITFYQ